ncbi:unnamed protein product [Orchesella dallaii]|uniref:Uncharacterized protein n=1 Tax=Orchesella dallaii TaxID=48710 RepID=A0ABP1RZ52_9HEXA
MFRYSLIVTVVCLGFFFESGNGLKCITCDDCAASEGTSQNCDTSIYQMVPDQKKMACSFESLLSGKIRKRCTLIRVSPSGAANSKIHCYNSPLNPAQQDCVCFCDDCNKDKPDPSKKEPCDNSGYGVRNELKNFIGIMSMFLGLLVLLF